MLDRITPLILMFNEAANIERVLRALDWANEVVIVDSFSSDESLEIVRSFPRVRVIQRRFDCFANQWNFGLRETGIATEWVLALDADYVLSEELVSELAALRPGPDVAGYRVRFRYCVNGKVLRGSLYPPVDVLFRREQAEFEQDGHTQRVHVRGRVQTLRARIHHDDRKSLARWLQTQSQYAHDEAVKLAGSSWNELGWPDRIRLVPLLSSPLAAGYSLVVKRCWLDGAPGLIYTAQRAIAELLLSMELLQQQQQASRSGRDT